MSTDMLKAVFVNVFDYYRLFPNRNRSRHIVAQAVSVDSKSGKPIFKYVDSDCTMERFITDVDPLENVQFVKHGI